MCCFACNNHTAKVLHRIIIGEEEASTGNVLFEDEAIEREIILASAFVFER